MITYNTGKTKRMTITKATRIIVGSYQIGELFTIRESLSKRGLIYEIMYLLKTAREPNIKTVARAIRRLRKDGVFCVCVDQNKSIYQKQRQGIL